MIVNKLARLFFVWNTEITTIHNSTLAPKKKLFSRIQLSKNVFVVVFAARATKVVDPVFSKIAVGVLVVQQVMVANQPRASMVVAHHTAQTYKRKGENQLEPQNLTRENARY